MFSIIIFSLLFLIVYLVYYYIYDDMLKKEKYTKISELVLFTRKFKLNKRKCDYRKLLKGVAIINAFIMAFTATVVMLIPVEIGFKLLIAFGIILLLLFSLYFVYGKYLNKKWGE